MAQIYVHVPFCVSRCIYCDFFSTAEAALRADYVKRLCKEIQDRRNELLAEDGTQHPISTIYIGGGTPSQLSFAQLQEILTTISRHYSVEEHAEVTIEVNPDDVTEAFIDGLSSLTLTTASGTQRGVTRVSMGVQTFNDELLHVLRRRHTSDKAYEAIRLLEGWCKQRAGQLNIDLIYGLPGQTLDAWHADLNVLKTLPIHHLSAYSLMFEEGTPLSKMRQQGLVKEVNEEDSLAMFSSLIQATKALGMEHYEISNYALPGCRSRHNSGYWQSVPYLGFGAGAHSFDGVATRRENLPSLQQYLQNVAIPYYKIEHLDVLAQYNEFVMCSLRCCEGVDLRLLEQKFGRKALQYCMKNAQKHLEKSLLIHENEKLHFSAHGIFVSDDIMSDLMCLEPLFWE